MCLWRRCQSWYVIYHILIFNLYQVHIIFHDLHQLVFCSRSGGHKTKWVGVGGAAGRLIGFWLFFRFLETTFDFGFYCSDIGNLKDVGNESGLRAHFGIYLNNSVPLWWYLLGFVSFCAKLQTSVFKEPKKRDINSNRTPRGRFAEQWQWSSRRCTGLSDARGGRGNQFCNNPN